jgi:hypothetical protein
MEIGEIIGIVFIVIVAAATLFLGYRSNQCPSCGGFRTMETIERDYTPLDTDTDAIEVAVDMIDNRHGRHKSTMVEWVERCRDCGEIVNRKTVYRHR